MKEFWEKIKNKIYQKPFGVMGIFSILTFFLGGLFFSFVSNNGNEHILDRNKPERQKDSSYRFTSPLLDCDYYGGPFSIKSDNLKEKIKKIINQEVENKRLEHVSVYFRDLNNGPTFGINEEEEFTPASLLKVPIMMAYFKKADEEPSVLKEKIVYKTKQNENLINQNIKARVLLEDGKQYEVEDLIRQMIIYSDNQAVYLLLEKIDMDFLNKVYSDLNIKVPGEKTENFMTVKEYASFFRILYNSSYLSREMSEKALNFLSQVDYKNSLVAGVPAEVTVAHKFGERVLPGFAQGVVQLHDCGVIYHPEYPYILCVMTRGTGFKKLEEMIKKISDEVYREVSK